MEFDIVRAWKDTRYRQSLTPEQQEMLPENPAGSVELTDTDLEAIHGCSLRGGGVGSNSLGNCIISLGATGNACNTFAQVSGNCATKADPTPTPNPTPPGAIAQVFHGLAEVIQAAHLT